jgi:hypothetical protein
MNRRSLGFLLVSQAGEGFLQYKTAEGFSPGSALDGYADDLPELLRHLGLKQPKGREEEWLDNRGVLNGLIEALRTDRDHLIRYQCAGWLRCSSPAKATEIQIPSQPLKPRTLSALEVLAEIASDASENVLIRVLAKSVLAKDEFIVRLWASRKEYIPLVYESLLATEKRLFVATCLPISVSGEYPAEASARYCIDTPNAVIRVRPE